MHSVPQKLYMELVLPSFCVIYEFILSNWLQRYTFFLEYAKKLSFTSKISIFCPNYLFMSDIFSNFGYLPAHHKEFNVLEVGNSSHSRAALTPHTCHRQLFGAAISLHVRVVLISAKASNDSYGVYPNNLAKNQKNFYFLLKLFVYVRYL